MPEILDILHAWDYNMFQKNKQRFALVCIPGRFPADRGHESADCKEYQPQQTKSLTGADTPGGLFLLRKIIKKGA